MSRKRWAALYRDKKSPEPGDLIFAYHRGVHKVLRVIDEVQSEFSNKRLVVYQQVADRHFNPIPRNRCIQTCDILYTMPFEEIVRNSNFVDPEGIIQRVREFA